MIGHVVLGLGAGHDGNDSVAVWHVSPAGVYTGAWLLSPGSAWHLPGLCAGRSVAAWDPAQTVELLHERIGFELPAWDATSVAIPSALTEVRQVRRSYESHVDSLTWTTTIPEPLPEDPGVFRRTVGLVRRDDACASAKDALATARMLAWTITAWRDTTSMWGERESLRRAFPEPTALPPDWERRVTRAQE
ncbi:DUF6218 family protein [Allokutzneria oryzae]|uniref:DUF6218 family protein n=1 Tax=Allokutzneria oryzae TaxID=1378989 RepID=A0ABV6A380_9PSEU